MSFTFCAAKALAYAGAHAMKYKYVTTIPAIAFSAKRDYYFRNTLTTKVASVLCGEMNVLVMRKLVSNTLTLSVG